jgi:Asp-tRNA(Asn)/Glu-tRNA(Gln) amidotransferase A subunit family amidase
MAERMARVDVYVAPSYGAHNLLLTNLTGHPAVVLPNGFTPAGTPTSITFTGRLYDEATVLAVAHAYQGATAFHHRHPAPFQAGAPVPDPLPAPNESEEYE